MLDSSVHIHCMVSLVTMSVFVLIPSVSDIQGTSTATSLD